MLGGAGLRAGGSVPVPAPLPTALLTPAGPGTVPAS